MAKTFGGNWTREKLNILEGYFHAYLKVMRNQPFSIGYIDAFAGAGSIELASRDETSKLDASNLIDGSVKRVLSLNPGFDGHVLIDRDRKSIIP